MTFPFPEEVERKRSGPGGRWRRRARRAALYGCEGDAAAIAAHTEPEGESDQIDRGTKRRIAERPRERQRAEGAVGQLHIDVMPALEGEQHVAQRRITKH